MAVNQIKQQTWTVDALSPLFDRFYGKKPNLAADKRYNRRFSENISDNC